jgi:glycosyltransferase involved in cell wall biosynthesis
MKKIRTSILIIAHNEEIHIDECLASIVNQTKKADEIILIAHNCTDRTVEIASKYREVVMHELKTEEE